MSHIIQYPVPFDILDAAVNECLKGYCNWGTYQRVPVTPASTTYKLTGNRDEDLGVVHVRKVGERLTELCLARPPNVRLKPTPEQRADAGGWRAWREAEKAQNRDRWSYVQTVYSALCSRLADDGMWDEVLQREAAGATRRAAVHVLCKELHYLRATAPHPTLCVTHGAAIGADQRIRQGVRRHFPRPG